MGIAVVGGKGEKKERGKKRERREKGREKNNVWYQFFALGERGIKVVNGRVILPTWPFVLCLAVTSRPNRRQLPLSTVV